MSVEQVVPTDELASNGPIQTLKINRLMTHGVIEARHGAHFTECVPDYERDEAFQREYTLTAAMPTRGPRGRPSTSTAAITRSTGRWSGCESSRYPSR